MSRGYLSRCGLGMVAGLAVGASVCLLLLAAPRPAPRLAHRTSATPAPATVGPFRVAIERFVLAPDPVLGSRRQRAFVQLHLWRPGGPVPLRERVRIDGVGRLQGPWVLLGTDWLIRNEFGAIPARGDYHHHTLGVVPATRHAGEVRAVLEFAWLGGRSCPRRADFSFTLPDGQGVSFTDLRPTEVR